MGINAWNTFDLRVEHPYIARKSDMVEFTSHAQKTACYQLQHQTKVHILALAWQTLFQKLHKMHSIKAEVHGIRQFN